MSSQYPIALPDPSDASFRLGVKSAGASKLYASGRPRVDRNRYNGYDATACDASLTFSYTQSEYELFILWYNDNARNTGIIRFSPTDTFVMFLTLKEAVVSVRSTDGWLVTLVGSTSLITPYDQITVSQPEAIEAAKTIPATQLSILPGPTFGDSYEYLSGDLVSSINESIPKRRPVGVDRFVKTRYSVDLSLAEWFYLVSWFNVCLNYGAIPFVLNSAKMAFGAIGGRSSGDLLARAISSPTFEANGFYGKASFDIIIWRKRILQSRAEPIFFDAQNINSPTFTRLDASTLGTNTDLTIYNAETVATW